MKRLTLLIALITTPFIRAQDAAAELEKEIADLVAAPGITVVHFWAPWCPNCRAEMGAEGWAKFIAEHPDVKFVFLNIWHRGQDPAPKLAAAGLGAQPNLILRTHPNAVSKAGPERLNKFLDLPVHWIPTTWIFREGRLRFAFNYGEMRFDILRQLIADSAPGWKH
jgi:thiol-disulfide isomerase/thioredoxin